MRTRSVSMLGIGMLLALGVAARGGGSPTSAGQTLAAQRAAAQAAALRSSDIPPAWSSSPASSGTRPKVLSPEVAKPAKLRKPPPAGRPTPSDLTSVAPRSGSAADAPAATSPTLESLAALATFATDYAHYAYLSEEFSELRMCESSDNYQVDTGNGYYGAYQFDEETWLGLGYSGYPDDAPPAVQDQAAETLHAQRGWEPWPTCSWVLGL